MMLESLVNQLKHARTVDEKLGLLDKCPAVSDYLEKPNPLQPFFESLTPEQCLAVKSVLAIGQGNVVFHHIDSAKLSDLLEILLSVERFYDFMGGIVGYHATVLNLIQKGEDRDEERARYLKPNGVDLSEDTLEVREAVLAGIEHMADIAEIYPIGGAGDRLNLFDEAMGKPLPAAQLIFCGRTLLEGLIRDLQAREYLYYKLHGKQLITPIAMMTSHEKDNERCIRQICEENGWFGRPLESFFLFTQPLVPMITEAGNWSTVTKPGGHGVIWKLAEEKGVFNWLESQGRHRAILRQINNPVAGTDHGLLAFSGLGCMGHKAFGFASCYRLLNTAEGVNVLIEKETSQGFQYCLTNIEYTEFEKRGIKDVPSEPGSAYSAFPSNTNILFVDLAEIRRLIKHSPIPGMLLNMKTTVSDTTLNGNEHQVKAGRLESTMQNIADEIVDFFPQRLKDHRLLRTFVTYNKRRKTLSVTKKSSVAGESIVETPEGAYRDLLENVNELFTEYCHFQMPKNFTVQLHPALGPLYSIIAQKIQSGVMQDGAELVLEIAELDIRHLKLDGSLQVIADTPIGKNGVYGEECGRCVLHNVSVKNQGIDRTAPNVFWKGEIFRHEALQIILHGNAEFFAEKVVFEGNQKIEVPDGHKTIVRMKSGRVDLVTEKIPAPTWSWKYGVDDAKRIRLDYLG